MNQRKNQIIEVASHLISESGYKGASVKKIADVVGIHQSTIFHYFKNKEEILLEVVNIAYDELTKSLGNIVENRNLNPETKLKWAINNHINLLVKNIDNVNVFNNELRYLSSKSMVKYNEMRKRYTNYFIQIINDIKSSNGCLFKGLDSKIVTFGILAMCNWVGRWYREGGLYNPEQISDIFYRLITQGSFAPPNGAGIESKEALQCLPQQPVPGIGY